MLFLFKWFQVAIPWYMLKSNISHGIFFFRCPNLFLLVLVSMLKALGILPNYLEQLLMLGWDPLGSMFLYMCFHMQTRCLMFFGLAWLAWFFIITYVTFIFVSVAFLIVFFWYLPNFLDLTLFFLRFHCWRANHCVYMQITWHSTMVLPYPSSTGQM